MAIIHDYYTLISSEFQVQNMYYNLYKRTFLDIRKSGVSLEERRKVLEPLKEGFKKQKTLFQQERKNIINQDLLSRCKKIDVFLGIHIVD